MTGYNGIFRVTNKNNKLCFAKSISNEDSYIQVTIPQGAYELETLNDEIRKITVDEDYFTEADYPFTIKQNFSTLGSIIEFSRQQPLISVLPDNSMQNLLGFIASTIYDDWNLSPNLVFRFLEANEVELSILLQWMLILVRNKLKNLQVVFNSKWWNLKISFQVLVLNWKLKMEI